MSSIARRILVGVVLSVLSAGCVDRDRLASMDTFGPDAFDDGARELPAELEEYREVIESSRLEHVRIEAHPEGGTEPWASKMLGIPYWPKDMEYPTDPYGRPLRLLVQLDFGEMPRLEGYPEEGILQVFLADSESDEHVYGLRSLELQPWDKEVYYESLSEPVFFRVVYHPEVIRDVERLERRLPGAPPYGFPARQEARLTFSLDSEPVLPDDYRFARFFGAGWREFFERFGERRFEVHRDYDRHVYRHALLKVGGYADFRQNDPREIRPDEDWLLLLEVESTGKGDQVDVMWGDAGVANFMIRPSDLEARDFSRVMYKWDCY